MSCNFYIYISRIFPNFIDIIVIIVPRYSASEITKCFV